MLRCIKFVLDTRTLGLKLCPKGHQCDFWVMECYMDSDYATDPVTRRTVSGYIIFVHGVPRCFVSRAQKSGTLSSCKAEWIALSEGVKDIKFVLNIMESMHIDVELPVIVRVDNTRAIFIAENVTTTSRANRINTRSKFVREFVQDGVLKIVFVLSEENDSDIMTKNVSAVLYDCHSKRLVMERITKRRARGRWIYR